MSDKPETHEERCKRELAEQEEIFAKVKEDSDRYDAAVAEEREASLPKSVPPAKPQRGGNNAGNA
jgi:hypothetical protein